jgi:predicted GIY-YIG superfamily endonuclease
MEQQYFQLNLGDLSWSDWTSFTKTATLKSVTSRPGFYRIRAEKCNELVYIGQTGRNLRERLKQLQKGTFAEAMPFNDPHTAAPNLWVWHNEGIGEYECSVAVLECDYQKRQVIEDYILWLSRSEAGRSTLCNHGNFHPNYNKSSDKKKGIIGGKINSEYSQTEQFFSTGRTPLTFKPDPLSLNWMDLNWSHPEPLLPVIVKQLQNCSGIYKIISKAKNQVIYIGESGEIKKRLLGHSKSPLGHSESELLFSHVYLSTETTSVHRHEIETDLIGGFYHEYHIAPLRQYNPIKGKAE